MEASIKLVPETWRVNKDGFCSVKIRVIHNRKIKYYSIKHLLKNDNWNFTSLVKDANTTKEALEKFLTSSPRGENKDKKLCYEEIISKATKITNDLTPFTFDKFEEQFLNKVSNWHYVTNALTEHIETLKKSDRVGYAVSFTSTLTAIKYFCEKKPFPKGVQAKDHAHFKKYKKLMFADITPAWLSKFEQFLVYNEKSTSTIGIYTRNLRVLFNLAIDNHNVKVEYPFKKYTPKTSSSKKRALTIEQVKAMAKYQPIEGTQEDFAKDMFIFSFLANGMNMNDIFRLKLSNIQNNEIVFVRQKTKRKTDEVKIQVSITEPLKRIINKYRELSLSDELHLFPVLRGVKDEATVHRLITQKTKVINKHLKVIAQKIDFDAELSNQISTYHARHSFATISKNNGQSIAFIKESLGHKSLSTTEKYLSSFDEETRSKAANELANQIANI